jgi:hypothetical protein
VPSTESPARSRVVSQSRARIGERRRSGRGDFRRSFTSAPFLISRVKGRSLPRIIHCRHCGADNQVAPDVAGKRCNKCGNAIFRPEVEGAPDVPRVSSHWSGEFFLTIPHAPVDRTRDVLRVVCPNCQFTNEVPQLNMIFICDRCGAPIAVNGYRVT